MEVGSERPYQTVRRVTQMVLAALSSLRSSQMRFWRWKDARFEFLCQTASIATWKRCANRCRRHSRITSFTQLRHDYDTYARANAPATCITDRKRSLDSGTRYAYTLHRTPYMHRDIERRHPAHTCRTTNFAFVLCTCNISGALLKSHQHTIKSRRRRKNEKHIPNQNLFALLRASFGATSSSLRCRPSPHEEPDLHGTQYSLAT